MTDENKQRLQEEREDAALELLMKEYARLEGEALWRQFLEEEAAEKEAQNQHREDRETSRGSKETNRQTYFLKHLGGGCKRAAVIFLVLVCLLSPLVISVEAFKIPVLNYFVTLKATFSGFNFGENVGLTPEQEEVMKLISSVPFPDGCYLSSQEVSSDGKIWTDVKCEGRHVMTISVYPSDGQINIDTEDITQVSMAIHDYEAVYLHKEGHRLMWMDAERALIFSLYGSELEESDFWRYAYALAEKLSQ